MTRCHKRCLEWQLTTRVFDFFDVGRVGIVASYARMFAKRAEASCATLAISKDQKKYSGSSRGKDLARLGNGKRRLTK